MVHCDIKPQNIVFFAATQQWKYIDLATVAEEDELVLIHFTLMCAPRSDGCSGSHSALRASAENRHPSTETDGLGNRLCDPGPGLGGRDVLQRERLFCNQEYTADGSVLHCHRGVPTSTN